MNQIQQKKKWIRKKDDIIPLYSGYYTVVNPGSL